MRSCKKYPVYDLQIRNRLKKIAESSSLRFRPILTYKRFVPILDGFEGIRFKVYGGTKRRYASFVITREMVGEKLGSLSPTRATFRYVRKKKKKKR